MHQQVETDQELDDLPNNSSCRALIKKSDYDCCQTDARYFLNMFYSKEDDDGGRYNIDIIQKPGKVIRNIPTIEQNIHELNYHHLGIQLSYLAIIIIICIFVIFIYLDMKSQYTHQLTSQKLHISQCIKSYHQNQCDNPVEILQQQCKKFKQCYHQQPTDKIKFTVVFAKVITHMMRTVVEGLGIFGVIVLLLVGIICAWKPSSSNNNENYISKIRKD